MLASYIIKNLGDDKDDGKKKGQNSTGSPGQSSTTCRSPTKNISTSSSSSPSSSKTDASPKFSEKKLVSILNYKGGVLVKPDQVQTVKSSTDSQSGNQGQKEDKYIFRSGKVISHQKQNVKQFAKRTFGKVTKILPKPTVNSSSSAEGSNKNTNPSKATNENISPSKKSNENTSPSKGTNETISPSKEADENIDQSEVASVTEKTIFPVDHTIELKKCEDEACGCRAIHCPFCDTSKCKPSIPSRITNHLENKHFTYGVYYEDLMILKCYKTCFNRSDCHYHCPLCKDVTFLKRIGLIKHLVAHAKKQGKKSSIVKVPDTKRPKTVTVNDHKIELCHDTCKETETPKGHYHCPICNSLHVERRSIICHVWRCEAQSKEKKLSEGEHAAPPNVTDKQLEEAYNMTSDLPSSAENENMIGHPSIIRTINDLPLEKCQEENCCKGKKHCVLCITEKYKPSYMKKLKTHYYCHWNKRIQFKGYYILPCHKDCRGLLGSGMKIGHHFHCPVCGEMRSRRNCFIHHLEICQGKDQPPARVNFDKSITEQMEFREVQLEEVDQSVEQSIMDVLPQEDHDDSGDLDIIPMSTIEIGDHEEKGKKSVEFQNLKIFNKVTAEISNNFMSVLKFQGLDNVLQEVSDQTGVSYLFSPGINSPVHSLQGNLQTLTKATKMIEKILGIKDNRFEEKSTNTEKTYASNMFIEDTGHQDEDFVDDDSVDTTTTPDTPKTGRKRASVKGKSALVPAKKIKKEPTDSNQYTEPIHETPGRRYSTRGVKVDFAKLLSGQKEKKSWSGVATENKKADLEGEEIVIIDENKKKMNVRVPKTVATTIRQKIFDQGQSSKVKDQIGSGKIGKDDISEDEEVHLCEESPIKEEYNETDDEESDGPDDQDLTMFTPASTANYVRKLKLSNSAIIPKITIIPSTPKKANRSPRVGPSTLERKGCNVVNKYRCTKCDFTCQNFIDCTDHMIEEHSSESILRCDICERHFEKLYHLNIHLETKHGPHKEERLRCQYCPKEYLSINALDHHVETKHVNKPQHPKLKCRRCEFVGKDRHDLENHVQSNHYQVGVLCNVCGKSFRNSTFLDQHMTNVHYIDGQGTCHICDKTFRNKKYLSEHIAIHTQEKKHACPICGRKFHKKSNMVSHKETHKNKEDRFYRFMCNCCGQKMNSRAHLNEHMNIHTGERPFMCEICGKSFAFRTAVYKHKVFCHSSHAPYKCTLCAKSFKAQRLLNQHMTTHTGKSLYKCDTCLKMFSTSTTLKTHKTKCKGLNVLPQMAGNMIIISTPKLPNSEIEIPAAETILQSQNIVENTSFRVENPVTTEMVITEAGSFIAPVASSPTKTTMETDEAPSDVAVYLCSECNAAFHDFAEAEQHVLIGHESANSTNQTTVATTNEVEADYVISM